MLAPGGDFGVNDFFRGLLLDFYCVPVVIIISVDGNPADDAVAAESHVLDGMYRNVRMQRHPGEIFFELDR